MGLDVVKDYMSLEGDTTVNCETVS
jgi:hypothetical protein